MKALKHTVTEEGEIFPGDLFYPGYFHDRDTSLFTQDRPIAWTTPDIRAHQLLTEGLAERLPLLLDLSDLRMGENTEVILEESVLPENPPEPEIGSEPTDPQETAEPDHHEE